MLVLNREDAGDMEDQTTKDQIDWGGYSSKD